MSAFAACTYIVIVLRNHLKLRAKMVTTVKTASTCRYVSSVTTSQCSCSNAHAQKSYIEEIHSDTRSTIRTEGLKN